MKKRSRKKPAPAPGVAYNLGEGNTLEVDGVRLVCPDARPGQPVVVIRSRVGGALTVTQAGLPLATLPADAWTWQTLPAVSAPAATPAPAPTHLPLPAFHAAPSEPVTPHLPRPTPKAPEHVLYDPTHISLGRSRARAILAHLDTLPAPSR